MRQKLTNATVFTVSLTPEILMLEASKKKMTLSKAHFLAEA